MINHTLPSLTTSCLDKPMALLLRLTLILSLPSLSLILILPSSANVPGGGEGGAPVTLTPHGGNVVLANGIITATIQTASARVISLKYHGQEMVQTSGNRRDIYFSMAGGASYEQPGHCVYSVTKQGSEHVDISCKRIYTPGAGDKQPWDIDIHYVLRSGSSGLYVYAIVEHPASYPRAGMGEWRMVWWMSPRGGKYLLERIYVDDLRHWEMPSLSDLAHAQPTEIKEIVRLMTGPWTGKYDCKYAYSADYGKLGAFGHASDVNNLGAWVVLGSHEFFNDGPTKQDLNSASGIIHLHLYENHYGAPGFTIEHGQSWKKIYGPWLLFCSSKHGGDANWADAREQARAEQAAWPYSWMSNTEYPSEHERGRVTGRLLVQDRLKPALTGANAWVGLALPEETAGNWQFQGSAYQYWVQAAADGSFSIPHVRPGAYTLYAFADGAVGEFSHKGVLVNPGVTNSLGNLTWNVPHPGKHIAWEIGIPDRSAAEFRHGNDYFTPFLYKQFSQEFPNPLEYDVSKHNWSTAWNYAHNPYLTGKTRSPWKWRIHFQLDRAPLGNATLTIAFAGSNGARMQIYVNDDSTPLTTFYPPNSGGNALIRESIHAKYGVSYITIPGSHLKVGANTISLEQASTSGEGNHVMYDYLNLELPGP